MKKIFVILLNAVLAIFITSLSAQTKKLKLFINDITVEQGVSKTMAIKVRDIMSLSIFENFSGEYQVITDDDIKIMFKKVAVIQATGCDAQTCVLQIAEAINADEIIYGSIKKDEGKIRITVQNIKRDARTLEITKKSIVSELFYESQLDWYSKEVAKKLINAVYKIDPSKAPAVVTGKFQVEALGIKSVEGMDISILKFTSNDEAITKLLDYYKELVSEGDELFKKNNQRGARQKYRDILKGINEDLHQSKREKMTEFTESVVKRIESTHVNEFKVYIEDIDKWLKAKELMDRDIIKKGIEKYSEVLNDLDKIPDEEKSRLGEIKNTIVKRISSLYLAWASIIEKEGDAFYSDYKFKFAIDKYNEAIVVIKESGFSEFELTVKVEKLDEKKRAGKTTGASWLNNRVRSYCDQAEYFNIRKNKSGAKNILGQAGDLIAVNSQFLTPETKSLYDEYSKLVGHIGDVGEKTKFFEESKGNYYGPLSLTFFGLSLGSFGGGYYFNTQLTTINSDYASLSKKYKASTDFNEATKLGKDMNAKEDEAKKTALYRNIAYGAGGLFLGVGVYFTYRYFSYKSMESSLKSSWNDVIFFTPLISYDYKNWTYNPNERGLFAGAVITVRF